VAFGGERSGVELDQSLGRRRFFEAVARLQSDVALLGSAAGGKARSLVRSIIAVARGVYIGVVASALLIGIGGNALLSQIGRHPAPLFVSANQAASSTSQKIASATTRSTEAVTSSPLLLSSNTISTVAPAVVDVSRVSFYFERGAGVADYTSRRTSTYSAHGRSNRRSPQR